MNYIEQEIEFTKSNFNLDEVLEFEKEHKVEIIRGEDYLYCCHIDNKIYAPSLTPLCALVTGIKIYKIHNSHE